MKEIQVDRSPNDDEKTSKEIGKWTTALMNTSGGLIVLYCKKPDSDQQRDKWLMGLESALVNNWIPESIVQSLIRFQYREIDEQLRVYMFVGKAPHVITFSYNAYGRHATCIRPIRDATRVQQMLCERPSSFSNVEWLSPMKKLLTKVQAFKVGDPIPAEYRENKDMEFKHCYTDISKRKELHSFGVKELKQRLHGDGGYIQYISAFANTHGGSLVLGVEEGGKFPVVRGFEISEEEKQKIHECLHAALESCIWYGNQAYKPCCDRDWKLLYHDVIEQGETSKQQLIEICVPKHAGGLFLRSPVYYMVDKGGALGSNVKQPNNNKTPQDNPSQHEMLELWKKAFHACSNSDEETSKQGAIKTHYTTATKINIPAVKCKQTRHSPDEASVEQHEETDKGPDETKLPKSFKESQSVYKTDITVLNMNVRDCCSSKLANHIQTMKNTKTWYPPWQTMQHRMLREARFSDLINFIDACEWSGVASVISEHTDAEDQKDRPSVDNCSILCHVLIIREAKAPVLICCVKDTSRSARTQEDLDKMIEFALCKGRMLKRQYILSIANRFWQSVIFHFEIQVLLVPTVGDITKVWDSRSIGSQPVTYPAMDGDVQHMIACTGLAEWLLKTRHSVKDRYGDILTQHLTEAQARILLDRKERVLIVSGKSGTGKTVIALHLVYEALSQGMTDKDVLYICSNEGLEAFIRSQVPCQVMVVKKADCLAQRGDLLKKKLVVVDDIHAIKLQTNWKEKWGRVDWQTDPSDLYMMLFLQAARGTNVAVFFDPDQDYMENLPSDFDTRLRDLAGQVDDMLTHDIQVVTLTERMRNSREINRFLQASLNQAKVPGTISCLSEQQGDDVLYEYIGKTAEDNATILNEKLVVLENKYSPKSIAILCDDIDQLNTIKSLLMEKFQRNFQTPRRYPVRQMVFCLLEDFGGLEADVVLFLLPPRFDTDAIKVSWKYINTISSRAKQRLELLLNWEPLKEETRQGKIATLLELFATVSNLCTEMQCHRRYM